MQTIAQLGSGFSMPLFSLACGTSKDLGFLDFWGLGSASPNKTLNPKSSEHAASVNPKMVVV